MNLDIVLVTYNSKKWLKNNIESIVNSKYDLKKISMYYVDNASTDDTVEELHKIEKKYKSKFNNFCVLENKKNEGFGIGNNKGAFLGTSPYIFFLNIDTEIEPDTFSKIEEEINAKNEEVGIYELRQKPYEHPKYYDPVTGYTSWSSGACFIIKRELFEQVKGFDKRLFMYCEDVDLSWNVRRLGYQIKYLYNVPIVHYSYAVPGEFKNNQFIYAVVNNLYLRAKYGNFKKFLKGHYLCFRAIRYNLAYRCISNEEYRSIRKKIFKEYLKTIWKTIPARFFKHIHISKSQFQPQFINDFDYEVNKLDAFYVIDEEIKANPLVSIIIRTCGRPSYLRETLISVRNQSYKNIEVVIVEDGKNVSEKMIKKEFSDLNIQYYATGEKVERSVSGNIGMKMAKGKYLNLLDDDDLFYPEHIEVLVKEMEKNKADIVYSTAMETAITIESKDPYKYRIEQKLVRHHGPYSKLRLYRNNITPIQAVLFKKEVFEKCGGFDENITALEDWDLWLRYSFEYHFHHIEKTTSIYRVPFNQSLTQERQQFLNSSLEYVINKHKNKDIKLSLEDIFWDANS